MKRSFPCNLTLHKQQRMMVVAWQATSQHCNDLGKQTGDNGDNGDKGTHNRTTLLIPALLQLVYFDGEALLNSSESKAAQ